MDTDINFIYIYDLALFHADIFCSVQSNVSVIVNVVAIVIHAQGNIHDSEICKKIVCWDTDINECRWETAEHRAYAGTQCGDKKWCFRGECVPDDRAPEGKGETCL